MFKGKQIRALTLTFFLFTGVLVFHLLGGGSVEFSPFLLPILLVSVIYFTIRPLDFFSGPDLAVAIVIFQTFGHFVISSGTSQNQLAMGISHLVASYLTYQFAKFFDAAADSCNRLIQYLFPKLPIKVAIKRPEQITLFSPSDTEWLINFVRKEINERAPPKAICA